MRVVLLMPSLSHRRLWASGSFARRQKSAMVVSSLKFRKSAICRSGSMPCWKLSTLPSESAGTTCLALTRVAAIWQKNPRKPDGFLCQIAATRDNAKHVVPANSEGSVDSFQHGIEPLRQIALLRNFKLDTSRIFV